MRRSVLTSQHRNAAAQLHVTYQASRPSRRSSIRDGSRAVSARRYCRACAEAPGDRHGRAGPPDVDARHDASAAGCPRAASDPCSSHLVGHVPTPLDVLPDRVDGGAAEACLPTRSPNQPTLDDPRSWLSVATEGVADVTAESGDSGTPADDHDASSGTRRGLLAAETPMNTCRPSAYLYVRVCDSRFSTG